MGLCVECTQCNDLMTEQNTVNQYGVLMEAWVCNNTDCLWTVDLNGTHGYYGSNVVYLAGGGYVL